MLNPVEIIEKKKFGDKLDEREISFMVEGYLSGRVRDYQMSAFLMAVWFEGMDSEETSMLTSAMLASGEKLSLEGISAPKVDKHSTGGVGDKVSICLAPWVASLGIKVPMLSGRALGHTGGTLDKLESIPGYRSRLSMKEMKEMTRRVGCFISGQTDEIAPADRAMYALRDVTGTVDCIPLITASILSKKLAEGIDALVMDVKYGKGAFMRNVTSARRLASSLKKTGRELGLKVRSVLTPMDEPLGRTVGNSLEVIEAVDLLRKKEPADLLEVTRTLAVEMVRASGGAGGAKAAAELVKRALDSGAAFLKLQEWIYAQGGKLDFEDSTLGLPLAGSRRTLCAWKSGFVNGIDARMAGTALIRLGGGRTRVDEEIDHGVGMSFMRKTGDGVRRGEPLVKIFGRDEKALQSAEDTLSRAITLERKRPARKRKIAVTG